MKVFWILLITALPQTQFEKSADVKKQVGFEVFDSTTAIVQKIQTLDLSKNKIKLYKAFEADLNLSVGGEKDEKGRVFLGEVMADN